MIKIEKNNCCGCSSCASICPVSCITMIPDEEGFLYPEVIAEKCINCGLCKSVCPFINTKRSDIKATYAFKAFDNNLRKNSSSGAVFSLLAGECISNNGIVCGVVLSDDCKYAFFTTVDNYEDLAALRGSKYLQADLNNIYIKVKEYLDIGKIVLFTGTPCQINGLKLFLKYDYENLLCADIICHGVPSASLWRNYITYLENNLNVKINGYNFRNKQNGWKKYKAAIKCNTSQTIYIDRNNDRFMYMFLHDYCLRPSCYNCKAKCNNMSDITMGDFWGIHVIHPDIDDDKGTSLVIIRTEKGLRLFNDIKEKGDHLLVDYKVATKYNTAEYKSVNKPRKRNNFYKDLNIYSFDKFINKYGVETLDTKIKKSINNVKYYFIKLISLIFRR